MALTIKAHYLEWVHPGRVSIIDEGLLQRTLSFSSETRAEEYFAHVLPLVRRHRAVAILGGSFERYETADDYKHSPRIAQGKQLYEKWKYVAQYLAEKIRPRIKVAMDMVEIDNRLRLEKAVLIERVYEWLLSEVHK